MDSHLIILIEGFRGQDQAMLKCSLREQYGDDLRPNCSPADR